MSKSWKDFKKPNKEELKNILSGIEYNVTQKNGTEKPFKNKYNENEDEGIYVDIVSGEPLFSSREKYNSGTGWPSFYNVIKGMSVKEVKDKGFFRVRTEVRSKIADSHLGHVFNDGPEPTGKRYCMNSAALRFIPKANLDSEGYGEFLSLFK